MINLTDSSKALNILRGYFKLLAQTGYVRDTAVDRFIFWLFIIDFTEMFGDRVTSEEYTTIRSVLARLFSNGCCLMPYPYDKKDDIILIEP